MGDIVTCNLTRFEDGKRIDASVCRLSGLDRTTSARWKSQGARLGSRNR